jgi:perosamine synthetase
MNQNSNNRIPLSRPSITDLELQFIADAAANGWGEKCYAYIDKFEQSFRSELSMSFSVATSSCTGALHMGLAALGIGKGDEVILADSNWIATVAPIVHLGAKPVFVDILEDTWCIDPAAVAAAVTPNTKAIIATHLYGNVCDMDKLLAISKQHNLSLIEDAAEAIGSTHYNRSVGTMGHFACFSFHGSKTMCTGEGGMFVTNDSELYERVLTLSNHGRRRGETRQFWPETLGFKYKMSNVQAAIGCGQVERIKELIARKREIFDRYREQLSGLAGVTLNAEREGTTIGAWMPTVTLLKPSSHSVQPRCIAPRLQHLTAVATPPFHAEQHVDLANCELASQMIAPKAWRSRGWHHLRKSEGRNRNIALHKDELSESKSMLGQRGEAPWKRALTQLDHKGKGYPPGPPVEFP